MELGNCIRANKKGFSSSNGFNKQNCAGILLENISIILLMTIASLYLILYLDSYDPLLLCIQCCIYIPV